MKMEDIENNGYHWWKMQDLECDELYSRGYKMADLENDGSIRTGI